MRVEPFQAIAALIGTVAGLAAAAWYWLGSPKRTNYAIYQQP